MSAIETFKAEVLTRLQAGAMTEYSASDPPDVDNVRRSLLIDVDKKMAPAIYARFGLCKRAGTARGRGGSCAWTWEQRFEVSIYLRSDAADVDDPFVIEVLRRLNPNTATGYQNSVTVDVDEIEATLAEADTQAHRIDVRGTGKIISPEWSIAPYA